MALLRLAWRELRDLPGALLRAHWNEYRGNRMNTKPGMYLSEGPLAWPKILAVFAPFLLAVLVAEISSTWGLPRQLNWLWIALSYVTLAYMLSVWIAGVIKGFPVWSLPSLGVAVYILTYIFDGGTGKLFTLFGSLDFPKETPARILTVIQRGFQWMVPMALIVILLLLLARLLPPLRSFFRSSTQDWSRLSFLLYGTAIPPMVMNDVYTKLAPFELATLLVLALGAWLFLLGSTPWRRLGSLLLGLTCASLVMALGIYFVFPLEPFTVHTSFPRWWEALQPLLALPAGVFLICLPALRALWPMAAQVEAA